MDHLKIWTMTAAILMLSAPAAAQWSSFGSIEPSTPYDTDWLPAGPPAIGEQRVYFNVISGSHYPPLGTATPGKPYLNPNVALLETQIEPFGLEYHMGYLGVWTDCNGDGYIGQAESALREYSAALLSTTDVCPLVEGPTGAWTAGANNYNGWVTELIPITNNAAVTDKRVYNDGDARVWGDFDRPDEHPTYKTCPLFPWPRGTYHNTGGVLNYVDCRVDILGGFNNVVDRVGDPAGLRFSDDDDGRTGILGSVDIGGNEDDSHSPVTVWDCSASSTRVGDELNKTPLGPSAPSIVHNVDVFPVAPGIGNLDQPTLTGLANHTVEGTEDCDTSNDDGHDVYDVGGQGVPETDFNGVDPNDKREANWNFGTATLPRGPGPVGAAMIPNDGGVGTGGTRWVGDSTWGSKPGPRSVRADLASGTVGIAGAYWLTFYAKVGTNTTSRFALPAAGPGEYGSWACGETPTGISKGWNCDESLWYQNPDGSYPNNLAALAVPGWPYHIRDVDCYDGRVGDSGFGVQPAYYGPDACP